MSSKLKTNFLFNLSYRIVTLLTPLITAPYVSRVLGAEGVGEYSFTYAVAHYFMIFSLLGISDYGNRSIARVRDDREKRSRVFYEIYYLQLLMTTVLTVAYVLYTLFFAENRFVAIVQGINVISIAFDITWFLFGMELFKITAIRNICVKIFSVILILVLVKTEEDVWLYALILAASTFISYVTVFPLIRKYVVRPVVRFSDLRVHIKPVIILFLPVIAINLLNYFDKIMVGAMANKTELGYYENAEKIIQIPNSLITALGTVMLPRVSNLVANRADAGLLAGFLKKSFMFVAFATSAFAFGICAVAQEFVPIFFGEGFEGVTVLIYFLAPTMLSISFGNILKTQYLLPNKRDVSFVVCLLTGVTLNLVLNYLLIPVYGAAGASAATLVAELVIFAMEWVLSFRHIPVSDCLKDIFVFLIIGAVMFLAVFRISLESSIITLLVKIFLGAAVYIGLTLIYMYLFRREVMASLIGRMKRKK